MAENKDKSGDVKLAFPEQINVAGGYGKSLVRFYLRVVSVSEENQYMQRFAKLSDDPAARQREEYEIMLDALRNWSVQAPTVRDDKGEDKPLFNDDAAESINRVFGEWSPANERVVNGVMLTFRTGMLPDTGFF